MSHCLTPLPWRVVSEGMKVPKIVAANGYGVCHGAYAPTGAAENMRLIAACVNACQGITVERLEDLGKPLMKHLFGADQRAARQLALSRELLEALQGVVAVADRNTDEFDRARAAIARAIEEADPCA